MKRIIALMLSLIVICAAFASCSKSEDKNTEETSTNETSTTDSESSDPDAVALSSEHYKITNAMLSYFFYSGYYSEMNQYGSMYQQYYGLDTSKSLKEQEYAEGKTWYSYFLENAKTNASDVLRLLEAANADGKAEDEVDTSDIDTFISGLSTQADSESVSLDEYIAKYFGKGVNEANIRDALTMYTRAYTYYDSVYKAMDYTEDECNEYYTNNKSEFMLCDFMSYTFSADLPKSDETTTSTATTAVDTTDPEVIAAYAAAKDSADKLAAHSGSVEDFTAALKKVVTDAYDAEKNGEPLTDEILSGLMDKHITEGATAQGTDNARMAWTSGDRKVGDTTVIDAGNGSYTVYCMVKPSYRNEYITKNVRHILFNTDNYDSKDAAKAACDAVYDEWNKGEDKSEEHFAELATEKTEDTGSKQTGGLYENVVKGTMVAPFEDWIYASSRKVGDTGIVESDYGYHIMYFVGDGDVAWINTAKTSLRTKELEDLQAKYQEDYSIDISDSIPDFMD